MGASARKILIVDDDPWVGKLVEFVARDLNMEPVLARDGTEALELFGEQLPDLVVLDVVLPKVDGIEVSRRIKTTGPGIFTPVVLVSGIYRGEPESLAKSRADAFFAKPLSPELLGRRLSALFPPAHEAVSAVPLAPAESGEVAFTAQPLALALARAHRQKATGVLHARTRGLNAELTLLNGQIVSVHSEGWNESLPSILLRMQRMTPEKRAQLEVLVASGAVPDFSAAAIREGVITAEELPRILALQQMLRVTEAFSWTDGFHHVVQENVSSSGLQLETPSLVHWGLRRMPVPPRALEDALPSMTGPLVRKSNADSVLKILPLSRAEKWLLSQANGKTAFHDLYHQVRDDKTASDVLARALLSMQSLGALDIQIPKMPLLPIPERPTPNMPTLEPAPSRAMSGSPCATMLRLWQQKMTGVLVVDLPDESTVFYFKQGQLVAVRPPGGERLESLLIRRGKIRTDILPQLRLLLAAGRNVGDALTELQAISLMQLHAFIRGELRVAMRDLMRRQSVDATFTESPLSVQDHVRHDWDTGLAVIESIRSQELTFVRGALPPKEALIQRDAMGDALVDLLTLTPNERNLWNLLGTPQPRERLESMGIISEVEQTRALWVLLAVGLVHQVDGAAASEEEDVVIDDDDDVPARTPELPSFDDVTPEEFHNTAPQPTIAAAVSASKGSGDFVALRRSRESLALPDMEPEEVDDTPVSRAEYGRLAEEKRDLERRLMLFLDQNGNLVSRELYEQVQAEKNDLQAQLLALVDEVIRLKSGGAFVPTGLVPAESTPSPGTFGEGDFLEGSVISFKRTTH